MSSGLSNSFSKLSPLNSYSILFIPFEYDMVAYILLKSLSAVKLILGVPAYKSIFLLYAPVLFALSTAEIIILFSSASLSGIVAFIVFESILSDISFSASPFIEYINFEISVSSTAVTIKFFPCTFTFISGFILSTPMSVLYD